MKNRILVIIEVLAVFFAGALAAMACIQLFGLKEWFNDTVVILDRTPVDFNALTWRTLVSTAIKYGWIFLLMFGLAAVLKKRISYQSLGLTTNGLPTGKIIKYAFFILCLGGILPKIIFALWPSGVLGPGLGHWHILEGPWNGSFWVFMLVSSIVIPPIVEEIFFRGYMQSRFHSVFKPGQAIFLTAFIFTLFHTQYFKWATVHLLMLLALFIGAWLLSFVRYKSGSILPGLIAHALVNIPVIGDAAWVVAGLMSGILIYYWVRKDPVFNLKVSNE